MGHRRDPFPFPILCAAKIGKKEPRDGDELTLEITEDLLDTEYNVFYERGTFATHFKARAMVARPLTHLTLRLTHEDWWNWSVDPTRPFSFQGQLYLEPAIGSSPNSLGLPKGVDYMELLAAKRRAGEDVGEHGGWGAIVGRLPDLKELKLVLETFDAKADRLEKIVECAKTWRFPIEDSSFELVWDGEVEDASWGIEPGELDRNYNKPMIIQEEEDDDDEDRFTDDERDSEDAYDSSDDESSSEDDEATYAPPLPPPPSWNRLVTRFEARVVRFARRKREQAAS
ncbi:hypothetical protein P171DRAFT_436393 [Karstenula rhodostoma CBS 690.94]|uniref:Uncharacterized protein n=1 Tax=Karstenula rhodostoma CBS 690.94 TaxID=1392251 RepID=A0A9P4P8Y2_9PLEO|nr:hypothetical protein P171DRAFT_436393 [Karstenula rhodostoma CBS 690.94]